MASRESSILAGLVPSFHFSLTAPDGPVSFGMNGMGDERSGGVASEGNSGTGSAPRVASSAGRKR